MLFWEPQCHPLPLTCFIHISFTHEPFWGVLYLSTWCENYTHYFGEFLVGTP